MANQKNHITNSSDYQRYLEGSMTSKECHEFEKQLLDEAFETEALEGLSEVDPKQLPQDLDKLSLRLQAKTKNSSLAMYWRIAASVVILALFSYMVYFLIDVNTSPELAQSKEKTEEKKALIPHEKKEVYKDSTEEEPEGIIAYRQEADKMAEEKPAALPSKIKATPIEEEMDIELDLEVIEERDKGLYDREDVQAAEPATLPTLAFEEAPVEIDPEARKKSIVATETVPPTSMQKSRVSARTDNLRTVTGKIVSVEDNDPVPGVNVIVKGSSEGTISDMEGNYKIDVPEDEHATLVYSYIGLHSKEVKVKDQKNIDVAMEPDLLNQLTEVVVTTANGYEVEPGSNSAPRPEIGYQNWKEYIKANLRYPDSGLEEKIKGTVRLKFAVGTGGKISNMEVLKSLGYDFDKEAIRLVLEGPGWKPAVENDSTVVREVKLKIRFIPEK